MPPFLYLSEIAFVLARCCCRRCRCRRRCCCLRCCAVAVCHCLFFSLLGRMDSTVHSDLLVHFYSKLIDASEFLVSTVFQLVGTCVVRPPPPEPLARRQEEVEEAALSPAACGWRHPGAATPRASASDERGCPTRFPSRERGCPAHGTPPTGRRAGLLRPQGHGRDVLDETAACERPDARRLGSEGCELTCPEGPPTAVRYAESREYDKKPSRQASSSHTARSVPVPLCSAAVSAVGRLRLRSVAGPDHLRLRTLLAPTP